MLHELVLIRLHGLYVLI